MKRLAAIGSSLATSGCRRFRADGFAPPRSKPVVSLRNSTFAAKDGFTFGCSHTSRLQLARLKPAWVRVKASLRLGWRSFAKGRSCLRNKKRYVVLPSPLTSVKWWRVCLDEAQRVEVPTAASARMARKLITDKRWCVSGTPIGRGRLDDLYGLLLFLSVKPFDEKRWFANSFVLSHGNALGRLSHLMKNIMWRSTKENKFVRQQMGIPDQEEKRVILQFSFVEQFFYDRQFDITSKAVHSWTEAKGPNWLSHSLQRLRAACCHPQVGTSGCVMSSCSREG